MEYESTLCSCGMKLGTGPENPPEFALFHAMAGYRLMEGCGRQIGPYQCCSVVQGDCLELMAALPDGCVDAVITDPPYGIGAGREKPHNGWRDYGISDWDLVRPPQRLFEELQRVSRLQAVWGGNYFTDFLPPRGKWLIWDKGQTDFSLADCEMAWTSLEGATRRIEYPRALALQDGKQHPTQKPVAVMVWNLEQLPTAQTILDPFCGSGTTLVAAKKLGRHYLGFEISEDYCRIARERIARVEAQPNLFEKKPEQTELTL